MGIKIACAFNAHRDTPKMGEVRGEGCGKVLLCGGYLILDRSHTGMVIPSSTARIFATIVSSDSQYAEKTTIRVISEQLKQEILYTVVTITNTLSLERVQGPTNPFVDSALSHVLRFLMSSNALSLSSATVTIEAENPFYSPQSEYLRRGLPLSTRSLASLPPFSLPIDPSAVHKTGLGSSAALTVALVSALLQFFRTPAVEIGALSHQDLTYRLSQLSHCFAQGKVGSGFDVASAVYGRCRYRRFSPEPLRQYFDRPDKWECVREAILELGQFEALWNSIQEPLPKCISLKLVLADVKGGASTPSMVRQILHYRDTHPDAGPVFAQLAAANVAVMDAYCAVCRAEEECPPEELADAIAHLGASPVFEVTGSGQGLVEEIHALARSYRTWNALFEDLGKRAGVDVVPAVTRTILTATEGVRGVVAASVPGAGGDDALFALVVGSEDVVRAVETCWAGLQDTVQRVVCPLIEIPLNQDQ